MSKVLVQRILQQYDITAAEIMPVQKGYRNQTYAVRLNTGGYVNLIIYKRESGIVTRIGNANRIGDHLYDRGFPTRRTADEKIVRLTSPTGKAYAALYNYLPGTTIPWEAYTMDKIKNLGACLSTVHSSLQGLERAKLPLVRDECIEILKRITHYFARIDVSQAMLDKLNVEIEIEASHYMNVLQSQERRPQPLHLDFVRGNILFNPNGDDITGILDFEKTAHGDVAYDIARTLAFLLVDCKFKSEQKIRKYFLHSGYNKRGKNQFDDWQKMETLVDFYLLHDFYKFLRHNPYESLPENEHFVRTRDILKQRKIITLI